MAHLIEKTADIDCISFNHFVFNRFSISYLTSLRSEQNLAFCETTFFLCFPTVGPSHLALGDWLLASNCQSVIANRRFLCPSPELWLPLAYHIGAKSQAKSFGGRLLRWHSRTGRLLGLAVVAGFSRGNQPRQTKPASE